MFKMLLWFFFGIVISRSIVSFLFDSFFFNVYFLVISVVFFKLCILLVIVGRVVLDFYVLLILE